MKKCKFGFVFTVFISMLKQNKFASSANMTVFKISDTWNKSFMQIMKSSSPKIDPCGTPHILSNSSVFAFCH